MNIPRSEHPKPQFQRDNWINLNGEWAFEIDNGCSGIARGLAQAETLSGKLQFLFARKASCPALNIPILFAVCGINVALH